MSKLTGFRLGEQGTYMGSGFDYRYEQNGGRGELSIRVEGVYEDDALILEAPEGTAAALEQVIEELGLRRWDGFSKSDKNVLDGESFSFSASFEDGSCISACGYMSWPKRYAEAKERFSRIFLPLYEAVRPDRRKVMERYFEEVILKDTPRLTRQEIGFPYISEGGNMFSYGKCELVGGAAMSPVYGDLNEPEYMLVIRLCEDGNHWRLAAETFKVTEKGEVLPWGSAEIDPNLFSSDKLYGHVFVKRHGELIMLGCFTQKGFSACARDTLYYIDLYDIGNKLAPLANEKAEGPAADREWWTPGKISNFIEVADKFGFPEAKRRWESSPWDPVFASGISDSCDHRLDILLTNNHGRGFYDALLASEKGSPVQGFRVKGTLYVR